MLFSILQNLIKKGKNNGRSLGYRGEPKSLNESCDWQVNVCNGTSPFGAPIFREKHLFRGHKLWSQKYVHIVFIPVAFIEGTPLLGVGRHFFRDPKLFYPLIKGILSPIQQYNLLPESAWFSNEHAHTS